MASKSNQLFLFYLEGNIGAGKSSLIKTLSLSKQWECWCEPSYNHFLRYHPLDLFRENPNTAAILQLHIIDEMFTDIKNHILNYNYSSNKNIIFIERSLESTFIFNDAAYFMGYISSFEHDFVEKKTQNKVKKLHDFLEERFPDVKIVRHNIFLDVSYETCLRRVFQRDTGEDSLSGFKKYLLLIHGLHHKNFTENNSFVVSDISDSLPHTIIIEITKILQLCLKK